MPLSQALGGPQLAVDLGTATTRVRGARYAGFDGASAVTIDNRTGKVVAVGDAAKRMAGRTPPTLEVVSPIRRGVITHFDAVTRLLWHALGHRRRRLTSWLPPRVVAGVPAHATEVQKRAVEEALQCAGARTVHLHPKVTLAAIGAGIPLWEAMSAMIVDIGAGTTEVAAYHYGTMVASQSTTCAGEAVTAAIGGYLQREHQLAISTVVAEEVKLRMSQAAAAGEDTRIPVRGRDRATDMPRTVIVSADELSPVVEPEIRRIAAAVGSVLTQCPTGVSEDIVGRGVVLTGGGALLGGLVERLSRATGLAMHLVDSPLTSVLEGAARCVAQFEQPSAHQPLLAPV